DKGAVIGLGVLEAAMNCGKQFVERRRRWRFARLGFAHGRNGFLGQCRRSLRRASPSSTWGDSVTIATLAPCSPGARAAGARRSRNAAPRRYAPRLPARSNTKRE